MFFGDSEGNEGLLSPLYIHLCLSPQVLLGWKYGDCVDEKAKTHPQLRTYKALTEKVQYVERLICEGDEPKASGLKFLFPHFCLCVFRRRRFTDGQSESPWRACWQWAGASTGPRMERACLSSGRTRKWERSLRPRRYKKIRLKQILTSADPLKKNDILILFSIFSWVCY